MKKMLIILLALAMLILLSACGGNKQVEHEDFHAQIEIENYISVPTAPSPVEAWYMPLSFEEALEWLATDVVIVQYIGRRPFGKTTIEFEFVVVDRILGNAADRIFVYIEDSSYSSRANLIFNDGSDYLLALESIDNPYATTHIDGFWLIDNIIIDLDNPQNSPLYKNFTFEHSEGLNLSAGSTRQQIVSYIEGITRNIVPSENALIRSEAIEDIILGSPYVLVVEINRPLSLSHALLTTEWTFHDIFYVTVISAPKGDFDIGSEIEAIFHANTVNIGERHIVAITKREWSSFYTFTSRDSLFSMEQLNEINLLLGNVADITFDLNGGTATAGNEDDFIPQTIAVNTTATQPASDPVRAHHQFTGWYTDETGGTLFDFSTSIAEDTIIYARWVVEPATPQDPPTGSGTTPPDTTLSPSPYIPWTPRTGTPDRAYTAYGDDNDDAPGESTPPVFIPPPSINTLIFTVGNIEYLLRNQPRTSVGAPFIDRATDRMMIPLRTLSQALDTEVDWCSDMRSALVHLPAGTLAIPADELLPDGMGSAIIVNDRIFIPLRFVMYAFDADVAWDSATRAAIITW